MRRRSSYARRLLVFVCACLVTAILAGAAYNTFQNWNLNRLHPAPGKIYVVDGSAMHIYCIGGSKPTVIFRERSGRRLVDLAEIPILVGHSAGGLYARAFAGIAKHHGYTARSRLAYQHQPAHSGRKGSSQS